MGDITANFSFSEFACQGAKCCNGSHPINRELVMKVQLLRGLVGVRLKGDVPLKINSGFRCKTHNARVKGSATDSLHTYGLACDIAKPNGLPIDEFAKLAEQCGFVGIGKYPWGIHVDLRNSKPSRWDYR